MIGNPLKVKNARKGVDFWILEFIPLLNQVILLYEKTRDIDSKNTNWGFNSREKYKVNLPDFQKKLESNLSKMSSIIYHNNLSYFKY